MCKVRKYDINNASIEQGKYTGNNDGIDDILF